MQITRIEVRPRISASDRRLVDAAHQLGFASLTACIVTRLFFVSGTLSDDDAHRLASALLADPVTETYALGVSPTMDDARLVERTLLPGVTDAVADSLKHAAALIGVAVEQAATGERYELTGDLSDSDIGAIARGVLVNTVIHRVSFDTPIGAPFVAVQPTDDTVEIIPVRGLSSDALLNLSKDRRLSLDLNEMRAIQAYFEEIQRDPTDVELEMLAQTWSEHCVHKTFRAKITYTGPAHGAPPNSQPVTQEIDGLLKTYIRAATEQLAKPWVRSAFVDNAGIVAFDDAFDVAFKVETHNRPSALEPFGGANTGAGGVIRDVLGVSARPIANTDVLCFGLPDTPMNALPHNVLHPRRIIAGVIHGIEDYGNKMGIPTVNGAVHYHPGYTANPLVFAGCVGLIPRGSHRTEAQPGDLIVVIGGRTGRDGLRGATFSSMEMDTSTAQLSGGAVQIGNPIVEKQVQEVVLKARDASLYTAITDCGAGGLSSAVGEMGKDLGAHVQLADVPLKYPGLRPWEIWLSEAQERMVLAIPPANWDAFMAICAAHDVEAVAIGIFAPTGQLALFYGDKPVGSVSMAFLHGGIPRRELAAVWTAPSPPGPKTLGSETLTPETLTPETLTPDPSPSGRGEFADGRDGDIRSANRDAFILETSTPETLTPDPSPSGRGEFADGRSGDVQSADRDAFILETSTPETLTPDPSPSGRGEFAGGLEAVDSGSSASGGGRQKGEREFRDVSNEIYRQRASTAMIKIARGLRQRETYAEDVLWECLRSRRLDGFKFRRQHAIADSTFVVDFLCYEARLVIEVDGAIHKEQEHQDRDRQRTIESLGYTVIRFSNDDIKQRLPSILGQIAAYCHNLTSKHRSTGNPPLPEGEALGVRVNPSTPTSASQPTAPNPPLPEGEALGVRVNPSTPTSASQPAAPNPPLPEGEGLGVRVNPTLLSLLAHPTIRSKAEVVHRYDHEVGGGTAIKPLVGRGAGPGDAAVIVPLESLTPGDEGLPPRAVALSVGLCPQYTALDPYAMAWAAVDEAVRNAVAVGADPDTLTILDNFSWGNTQLPDRLGSLVRCAQGCYDAALAYGTPFISGKDSLNNEYVGLDGERHSIPGTLVISALGIVPDAHKTVTSDFKQAGDPIFLVGETEPDELGGSLYAELTGDSGIVPQPVRDALERYRLLHRAIRAGYVTAAHDCSEGGLSVALAEMCIGGQIGADITLDDEDEDALFCESQGRIIVAVDPAFADDFAALLGEHCARIGTVGGGALVIAGESITVDELAAAWGGVPLAPQPSSALTPAPSPSGRGESRTPDPEYLDIASQAMIYIARDLRQRQTRAEDVLWECLRDRRLGDLKFRRQHPIAHTTVVADFLCYEAQTIIDVDGPIHLDRQEADNDRQRDIEALGYTILRFSNEQIINQTRDTLASIAASCIQARNHTPKPSTNTAPDSPLPEGEGLGVRVSRSGVRVSRSGVRVSRSGVRASRSGVRASRSGGEGLYLRPKPILLLHATGTNRDRDAALACELAGGAPEIVTVNQLVRGERHVRDYAMLVIPGGFSYGDDLGAGVLWALDLRERIPGMEEFVRAGKPVLGICNGFQTLVKSGLLPGHAWDGGTRSVTLTYNAQGRFECRWVTLHANPVSPCLFTEGLDEPIHAPIAHGEGRVMVADEAARERLWADGLPALTYGGGAYPDNPNGSVDAIAGLCSPEGTVFGLMPHPENHVFPWQHPQRINGYSGLRLFENGIRRA